MTLGMPNLMFSMRAGMLALCIPVFSTAEDEVKIKNYSVKKGNQR
jgi:hypothetical protein